MNPDTYGLLRELLARAQPFIISLLLTNARMLAVTSQFPLFSWSRVTGIVRTVFSLAVSVPLAFAFLPDIERLGKAPDLLNLGLLLVKEVLVGTFLGFLLGVPFWGVQAAGDIIDMTRGASAANQSDPVNAAETTTTGVVLLLTALSLFVLVGGIYIVIDLVRESYDFWPATHLGPIGNFDSMIAFGKLLTLLFQIGMVVGGPALIAMFLVDLVLSFGTRAAKGIQISDESSIIKNLVITFMIPLYGVFLAQYIQEDMKTVVEFLRAFIRKG